jgi:23S rRNA pseudouridine2604 synthase
VQIKLTRHAADATLTIVVLIRIQSAMTLPPLEPVRLAKRVAELADCSRRDAEQYIEGGWVTVDGEVIEEPQFKVLEQTVVLLPNAHLAVAEPATILLHKPLGYDADEGSNPALTLITPASRYADDRSGMRSLKRHFSRLTAILPLEADASGLIVFTQDWRVTRKLSEDADRIEQEYIVEVSGELGPYGLKRLSHGLSFNGRPLPPIKVSWQNEVRLRFALKGVQRGQIRHMCAAVELAVVAIKRIRIGSISLGKMPPGEWRYLPSYEKF